MSLINCEINLILTQSENCLVTSEVTRDANPDAIPTVAAVINPTNVFKLTDTKLYVPVVTLLTEDDNKLLEPFKRTIKWNKYRLEMSKPTKTNNSNYLVVQKGNKVDRLFVLSVDQKCNKIDRLFVISF